MTGAKPIVLRLIHLAGADTYLPLSPPEVLQLGRAGQPDSYQANCATNASSAGSEGASYLVSVSFTFTAMPARYPGEAGQSGFPQLIAGTGTGGGPAAARTTGRRRDRR
jgi:hypothetical protein